MKFKHSETTKPRDRRKRLPKPLRRLLLAVVVWDLSWKGLALWRAARKNQLSWFIALLVTNTAGILPIVYLRRADEVSEESED